MFGKSPRTPASSTASTPRASRSPTPRRPPGRSPRSGRQRKFDAALVNPANRRKLDVIIVGTGLAGASAAATLGEAGYNVKSFCFQDSPAPRALHRRAGRHQRREELQGGRRLRPPPLLRHRQGRRLPRPRDQRLPPGRGQREHHRPVRRAGRALRPRVRRPARQPLLRRRPGLAHLLRPRPDRPAAAHRRLPGARAPGRGRHGRAVHPPRDARARSSTTAGPAASSPATSSPARSRPTSPTPSSSPRAATATSSTSPPTRWAPTSPRAGGRTARAPTWPTPATRRSTPRASRSPASTRAS